MGGTVEFARASHGWPRESDPEPEFHAPDDYRAAVRQAADAAGVPLDIACVEVPAGAGSLHHGWVWHGSGPNRSDSHRRALVLHCASSETRFDPTGFGRGMGPVYSRYATPGDDAMDERHFPIIWRRDGSRGVGI